MLAPSTFPPGPAAGVKPLPVPDLTMLIDIEQLWPDPMACPDWPLSVPGVRSMANLHAGSAAERLASLSAHLNRGNAHRPPTEAERAKLMAEHFSDSVGSVNERWHALGFHLRSRHPASDTSNLIVEAAHIRGHLRKRQAMAERSEREAEDRKRRELQHRVDQYQSERERRIEELAGLAEAEKRHQQRLDDELASARAQELRRALTSGYHDAAYAAQQLGIEAPPPPEVVS